MQPSLNQNGGGYHGRLDVAEKRYEWLRRGDDCLASSEVVYRTLVFPSYSFLSSIGISL